MESEDSLDITWTYPPQPGVVITGQTLLVSSAGLSSEGAYTCTVSDNSTDGTAAASGTLEIGEGWFVSLRTWHYPCMNLGL